jgi:ribosomal protein S18 acetylase RimI-like enzyme
MLHAGLDLSRKKLDVCLLSDGGEHLGRLAVAPDKQGRGIGTSLLFAVLPFLPDEVTEIWVFTGKDSKQNLAMYTKHGYEEQYDQAAGELTYTYLRRVLGEVDARNAGEVAAGEASRRGE